LAKLAKFLETSAGKLAADSMLWNVGTDLDKETELAWD
jgi:hypothetical protein